MKEKIKLVTTLFLMIGAGFLSGCASIVSGTHQTVSVVTPPAKNATCVLKNSKGIWYINKTPGSTVIHQAYGDLKVKCSKSGYYNAYKRISSHTKGMAFGNAVFGGVIGAGVDISSGAAYHYPTSIVIPMHRKKLYGHEATLIQGGNYKTIQI